MLMKIVERKQKGVKNKKVLACNKTQTHGIIYVNHTHERKIEHDQQEHVAMHKIL